MHLIGLILFGGAVWLVAQELYQNNPGKPFLEVLREDWHRLWR